MRGRTEDLRGRRSGRLVVLRMEGRKADGSSLWLCQCDCGTTKVIRASSLMNGDTVSCGCYQSEQFSIRKNALRHGKTETRAYRAWCKMRGRCKNPREKFYRHYGGRGITICPEWDSFEQFYADMGDPPEGMTLDRVNPNGNYEPSNCRWADWITQSQNRRNVIQVSDGDRTQALPAWAREIGIGASTLLARYRAGDRPPHLFRPVGMGSGQNG